MILLWPEGKLLARIVFISTFSPIQLSLVSSLFVFFAVAIVLSSLSLNVLLIQLSYLHCACAVLYSTDSPSSFSVCHFVWICEVLD